MQAKPWYLSKTVWGALLTLLTSFIKDNYHIDLSDEVGNITSYTLATLQFLGVIVAIVGRFKAIQPLAPLTLGRPSSTLPLLLASIGTAGALSLSALTLN